MVCQRRTGTDSGAESLGHGPETYGSSQRLRSGGAEGGRGDAPVGAEAKDGQRHPGRGPGWLTLVSLGPGSEEYLTPRALEALAASEVVVGYKMYVELVRPLLQGQEIVATGMMGELQRCQLAIDRALAGAKVALVSSGDVGIYGMAGLALEICRERGLKLGPLEAAGRRWICLWRSSPAYRPWPRPRPCWGRP